MKPEISCESVYEQVQNGLDGLDEFLKVLQPKMEANVRRRRRKEEIYRRENATKMRIARCREALCLLWKQLKPSSKTYEENYVHYKGDDKQHREKIQKERMNRYLKQIGCPLRIL